MGMAKKVVPLGERKRKTRRYAYRVHDPFIGFWFRFAYPHKELTERGEVLKALETVKSGFDAYAGPMFEDIALQIALEKGVGVEAREYGRWWSDEGEIDLVFLEGEKGKYRRGSFFEVKWFDLREGIAVKALRNTEKACEGFPFKLEEKKFGLVARRITGEENLRGKGYIAYDLADGIKGKSRAQRS